MLLHCWICSLQGTRIDSNPLSPTIVAEIIEDKVKLPLRADMFKVYDPDKRGLSDWPLTDEWDHMLHKGHLPWEMVTDHELTVKRMSGGGPERLLTDQGWICIDDIGIVPEGGRVIVLPLNYGKVEEIEKQEIPDLYCKICGAGPFKNKQQKGAHMRWEHKEKK